MTTTSIFDHCTDQCGWIAAFVSAISYGSYGVPIKETKRRVRNLHPLVLQSYKTLTMFLTCWLVLLLGVTPGWTNWGLISGTLWVLGGTGGIYAIRAAGMAIAVGTWASTMIFVNFVWGILVFQEPVADIWSTVGAFLLLTLGLIGMSKYSAPPTTQAAPTATVDDETTSNSRHGDDVTTTPPNSRCGGLGGGGRLHQRSGSGVGGSPLEETSTLLALNADLDNDEDNDDDVRPTTSLNADASKLYSIELFGRTFFFTRRAVGIGGAVFNGLMTGTSVVPLHFAKKQGFGGAHYMIPFAIGGLIANVVIWIIVFGVALVREHGNNNESTLAKAYAGMPEWHLRKIWLPGFMAGLLLAIAMFGTFITVTYLGQGVGNSIIQSKILISGLWGIFWYGEIKGCAMVSKWFLSASLTVLGIIWLSQERLSATKHERMLLVTT